MKGHLIKHSKISLRQHFVVHILNNEENEIIFAVI